MLGWRREELRAGHGLADGGGHDLGLLGQDGVDPLDCWPQDSFEN